MKSFRKKLVPSLLSFALLLTAVGCQSTTPTASSNAPTESSTTHTISTTMGDVEIPVSPQRVIILDDAFGDVLSLGITPAAVSDSWAIPGSPVEEALAAIPRATELEEIMAIQPDLILTSYADEAKYEKLSKIAPTVKLRGPKDKEQTTEDRLHYLGEVLGVEKTKVDSVLSDYQQHIQQAKKRLTDAGITGKTLTLMNGDPSNLDLIFSRWKGAHALYNELGMTLTDKSRALLESGEWYASVSLELLPEYAGEYIVYYGEDNQLEGNPVYESLDAVKNGKVFVADEHLVNFNDLMCVEAQIDFFVDSLISVTQK